MTTLSFSLPLVEPNYRARVVRRWTVRARLCLKEEAQLRLGRQYPTENLNRSIRPSRL